MFYNNQTPHTCCLHLTPCILSCTDRFGRDTHNYSKFHSNMSSCLGCGLLHIHTHVQIRWHTYRLTLKKVVFFDSRGLKTSRNIISIIIIIGCFGPMQCVPVITHEKRQNLEIKIKRNTLCVCRYKKVEKGAQAKKGRKRCFTISNDYQTDCLHYLTPCMLSCTGRFGWDIRSYSNNHPPAYIDRRSFCRASKMDPTIFQMRFLY